MRDPAKNLGNALARLLRRQFVSLYKERPILMAPHVASSGQNAHDGGCGPKWKSMNAIAPWQRAVRGVPSPAPYDSREHPSACASAA
jgi:hypothetical protein